jgi:iron complex outermembrane recepter protein
VTIRSCRPDEAARSRRNRQVTASRLDASINLSGEFMFKRTQISTGVLIALGSTLAAPSLSQAQETQRVEVTGSSIKRIDVETALPVQVITRSDIARTGATNTEELLNSISATSSAGGLVNATGAGSSTYGESNISLRGLGGARTLILVNGRRLAAFAGGGGTTVNVNTIPIAAIERIDVLKDGASSLYGSDAVAGVINFILTKSTTDVEVSASIGSPTTKGGGQNYKTSIVGGFGDLSKDRFNVTLSGTYEKDRPLFAKDREYAKSGNFLPYYVAGATGQGNIEGAYTPGSGQPGPANVESGARQPGFGNSPGAGYGNPLAASGRCGDINMFLNPTPTTRGTPFCAFDSSGFVGLIPKRELSALTGNFTFKLSENHELFSDLLYAKSVVTQQFQPSPLRRSFMFPSDTQFQLQGVDPVLLIRPNNPNYQIAADYLNSLPASAGAAALVGQPLAVTARVFDFGLRTSQDTATQTRLVAGGRGTIIGQDYEVAVSRNGSKTDGKVPDGYFSQVAFARVVNQLDSDYNPWSLTQSATFNQRLAAANAKYTGGTQSAESTSNVVDAKLSGGLFQVPGGQAQYAVGAVYRQESYVTTPSAALETGDIAGLGGATPPIDRDRKTASLWAELNFPILKSLEGNVSVRGDKYSVVGNAKTYKANLRWSPVKSFLVRGSTGTGFRAPTLDDLYAAQTTGTSEQFTDPAFPANPNIQVTAVSGGNPNLKPEKSRQGSLGVVIEPANGFTVSADYFRIKMKDVITTPSAELLITRFRAGDPAYAGLVTLNANNEVDSIRTVLSNTGSLNVSGADFGANFRSAFAAGRLDINFNGTYMQKFDEATPSGALSKKVGTIVDADGAPVLGADNGGVVLRWRHVLSTTYTEGNWAFTLAQNFTKGYRVGNRQIDDLPVFVPDYSIYDVQMVYTGVKNMRLGFGLKNLFDKQPPIFVPASNQFQAGYDITQYDPRGRMAYFTVNYKF